MKEYRNKKTSQVVKVLDKMIRNPDEDMPFNEVLIFGDSGFCEDNPHKPFGRFSTKDLLKEEFEKVKNNND
jgi:hypothetical protein